MAMPTKDLDYNNQALKVIYFKSILYYIGPYRPTVGLYPAIGRI